MNAGLLMKRAHQVHEDINYYKERVRELESALAITRSSTIRLVINRLEWLRNEKAKSGYPSGSILQCIDIVKELLD